MEDISTNENDFLNRLPPEIILKIFNNFMQLCELKLVRHVCRQWYTLSEMAIQRKSKITIESLEQLCSDGFRHWIDRRNPDFLTSVQMSGVTMTQLDSTKLNAIWTILGANLHTLNINTSAMATDQFVKILACTPKLKTLKVDRLHLFDDLEDSQELHKLDCLQLSELTTFHYTYFYLLTDSVFEKLISIMPNVQNLDIFRWQETPNEPGDITWSKLISFIRRQSSKLKSLGFHGWAVNQDSIADLSALDDLRLEGLEIKVCYYNADNEEILNRFLRKQKTLKNLTLYSWSTTNHNLEVICDELKNLEDLSIEESHCLDDDGIIHLSKLKNLKHLCLGNPCITYDAVTSTLLTNENTNLESFEMHACGSNDIFINSVHNLRNLTVLYFENWDTPDGISDDNIRKISKHLAPTLEVLKIGNCNQVTKLGIYDEHDPTYCISNLKRLTRFELMRARKLEDSAFDEISRLKFLRHLNVSGSQIGDVGLAKLSTRCVYLESLDLSDCHSMSDLGLNAVFKNLLNFKLLRLKYNYGALFTNAMKAIINTYKEKVSASG